MNTNMTSTSMCMSVGGLFI